MIGDSNGNIIPVKAGERAAGTRDGKWIQVYDEKEDPTGLRNVIRNPLEGVLHQANCML